MIAAMLSFDIPCSLPSCQYHRVDGVVEHLFVPAHKDKHDHHGDGGIVFLLDLDDNDRRHQCVESMILFHPNVLDHRAHPSEGEMVNLFEPANHDQHTQQGEVLVLVLVSVTTISV